MTLVKVSTLIRFMRVARMKKMLKFEADKAILTEKCQAVITAMSPSVPFELVYADLFKAIKSPDTMIVLETIAILETSAAAGPLAPFEFELTSSFITTCMVTTFPDTRQKMMKTITSFFVRLRSLFAKDIKRY